MTLKQKDFRDLYQLEKAMARRWAAWERQRDYEDIRVEMRELIDDHGGYDNPLLAGFYEEFDKA